MNAMIEATAKRSPVSLATPTDGYMGDLVAWRIGDFKQKRADMERLFADCGFAGAIDSRLADPAAALAEAARTGDKGRHIVVKPFARPNKDTMLSFGVYTRNPEPGEKGDEWICGARVRVQDGAVVACGPEDGQAIAGCMEVAQDIAARAELRRVYTLNGELSTAILAAGESCMWAPFRRAGGVYWVHRDHAANMRKLLDSIEEVGEFWATLQPLMGDADGRTARNVGAAATMAMVAALEELAADLVKAEDAGMRKSTLEARELRCQQLVIQAELYREALAANAEKLNERLADIHKRFGALLNTNHDDAFEGIE